MTFNKIMLIILAMQLNIIIYFLGQIRWENDAVYRFLHLRAFISEEMSKQGSNVNTKPRTEI